MRNFLIYFLLIIVIGEIITIARINSTKSPLVSPEPTAKAESPSQSPSPTPSPSPLPTPKPKTPSPSPSPIPQPTYSSQQINEMINEYAGKYGVSPDVMRHIALCESGFNPLATNLSYAGLFQYGTTTWKNLRTQIGKDSNINLRLNAKEAIETTAYALSIGKKSLWPNCVP